MNQRGVLKKGIVSSGRAGGKVVGENIVDVMRNTFNTVSELLNQESKSNDE